MTKRIFRNILLVSLAALVLAGGLIMTALYNLFKDQVWQGMKQEAEYVGEGVMQAKDPAVYLASLASYDTRITWIDGEGSVLYDNSADVAGMENHLGRAEITDAMSKGQGKAERYSVTLSEVRMYYALLISDGSVIRLSKTRDSVWGLILRMLSAFVLIFAGAVVLSAIIARRLAKRIVAPINDIDLGEPEKNDFYPELSPLLIRISDQSRRISNQKRQLAQQQYELGEITRSMKEGLIILNRESKILAVNESAIKLFGAPPKDYSGRSALELNRSLAFKAAVEEARKGEKSEHILEHGGLYYQITGNPVKEHGELTGIIVLIVDVTERLEAEKTRREFSANVSHELKTPLTSILGFAEIMKDKVARPEDMRGFASKIYDEAKRLIALIDDIIKLSKLDEGDTIDKEPVGLLSVAQEVKSRLDTLAEDKKVSITVLGDEACVLGARHVLMEMVYNLVENAVKYNRENGSVTVTVKSGEGNVTLTVTDTGIGIPAADQPKVFERFYRVDKSHSKETGGTGLGLSIVKHAAEFHNASVDLKSVEGEGTTVEMRLPKLS